MTRSDIHREDRLASRATYLLATGEAGDTQLAAASGAGDVDFLDRTGGHRGEEALLELLLDGGEVLVGPRVRFLPVLQESPIADGEIDGR